MGWLNLVDLKLFLRAVKQSYADRADVYFPFAVRNGSTRGMLYELEWWDGIQSSWSLV